jgi:hypothetical protein
MDLYVWRDNQWQSTDTIIPGEWMRAEGNTTITTES